MIAENKHLKVDIENLDIFPVIIDYDFTKMRPRGGTSRIDFFMYGKLNALINDINVTSNLFIRKKNMIFSQGIFLVDFSKINENIDNIIDMIKNIGRDTVYIEYSNKYSIEKLVEKLNDIEIVYLDF